MQTGKTFLATVVIPAVIRENNLFGYQSKHPAEFIFMDTSSYPKNAGAAGFLFALLFDICRVTRRQIPFLPTTTVATVAVGAIRDLLSGFSKDQPCFFILDEVRCTLQSCLCSCRIYLGASTY